jgi:hypothetical protein
MGTEPNVKQGATASTPIFIAGQIAGVLVRDALDFRFVAVDRRFLVLDGSRFRDAEAARQSAVRLEQATAADQSTPDSEDCRVWSSRGGRDHGRLHGTPLHAALDG